MLEREQTLESRSRLENLDEFMSVPKDYEEKQEFLEISDIVDEVLQKSGYRDMLEREQTLESRRKLR